MFFKGINFAIGAATLGVALMTAAPSYAVLIQGTSKGQFSNITSCGGGDCAITGPNDSVLEWGSTSSRHDLQNPSTLTANNVTINVNTNANDVVIGKLTWYNSATLDSQTPDSFGFDYKLTVTFTSPLNAVTSQTFDLTIINTTNPTGDKMTLVDLNSLVFNLPGVTVSDLHYDTDSHSSISNGKWYNKEYKTATLYILADFKADPTPAPEPATLSLMGAGLAGLAARKRRKSKQ
ncbi:MAG TPA: choice-of-anchor K domain-containing protein [Rhizomicrobium sp.]|nr:choice-of-anchor K domain-containing protein [Rhizomicrobium sp.]